MFVPFGGGHAVDLAVLVENVFLRIQCKTGWKDRGCILFNSYATDHGHGQGSYKGLADLFGVFYPPSQALYFVPVGAVAASGGRLRLEPCLNNQRRKIRFAGDYVAGAWTVGRLAALGRSGADDWVRSPQPVLV